MRDGVLDGGMWHIIIFFFFFGMSTRKYGAFDFFFFKREQIVTGGRQTICVFYSNKMNQNKLSDYSRLASHVLLLMVGLSGRQNTGESRKTSTN